MTDWLKSMVKSLDRTYYSTGKELREELHKIRLEHLKTLPPDFDVVDDMMTPMRKAGWLREDSEGMLVVALDEQPLKTGKVLVVCPHCGGDKVLLGKRPKDNRLCTACFGEGKINAARVRIDGEEIRIRPSKGWAV